ncbi:DUF742 domain-containing protein [Micromonospora sp. NPDC049559]|uniref:DUF742 domain-containing protein n=1 Tax=Micromonospora sp. NPDC049559 TaxID=3155923 RepID=UPI003416C396
MRWEEKDEDEPEPTIRIRPYLQASSPVEPVARPVAGETGQPPAATPAQGPRPFVLTSGRVAGVDPAITLETQVTARLIGLDWDSPELARLSPESRSIVLLCAEPLSVAELSARLRLHLGVTKVLVGDLRAAGHLDVHTRDIDETPDPDLILRVIDGLRAIS